jgi:LmbE family N-acetylglucosaminyl deacetylase
MNKRVLGVFAHPDDAEIFCGGTLALLHSAGWEIHIATMTAGDCGTRTHSREDIRMIRKQEAKNAVALLNGMYHCLECDDVFILYDRETLLKGIRLMRDVKPAIVFTASPVDYIVDHEMTSAIVRTACFSCGMINIETPGVNVHTTVPYLYYVDPMEGKNIFGEAVKTDVIVDISTVMDTKVNMLSCHGSQRDWLKEHHGIDEYIITMKRIAEAKGNEIHVKYAEGFRQHLGHGYPQNNILKEILNDLVIIN